MYKNNYYCEECDVEWVVEEEYEVGYRACPECGEVWSPRESVMIDDDCGGFND